MDTLFNPPLEPIVPEINEMLVVREDNDVNDVNGANGANPKLVVLDLDFTLWPFDCGSNSNMAPFRRSIGGIIVDKFGRMSNPYKDVLGILSSLVNNDIPIAICSRNPDIHSIANLMSLMRFDCKKGNISLLDCLPNTNYIHAYSSDKTGGKNKHFTALKAATGVDFNQMIFFDDLLENITFAVKMGITSVLVKEGLTWEAIRVGVEAWRSRSSSISQTEKKLKSH